MNSRKLSTIVISAPGLALLTSGMARGANAIQNPGFVPSMYGVPPKSNFSAVAPTDWSGGDFLQWVDAPGTATIASGAYGGGPVYGPFPNPPIPMGYNFVEADGDPNYSEGIYQTINGLTVGTTYYLSFLQAAGEWNGPQYDSVTTEQWEVSLGSQTQYSQLMTTPAEGVTPWNLQTLSFTATGSSEMLTFFAVGTPTGEPPMVFLADPDMEVPEPSAFMLLAGVGAVCGLGRMRRRWFARRSAAAT